MLAVTAYPERAISPRRLQFLISQFPFAIIVDIT